MIRCGNVSPKVDLSSEHLFRASPPPAPKGVSLESGEQDAPAGSLACRPDQNRSSVRYNSRPMSVPPVLRMAATPASPRRQPILLLAVSIAVATFILRGWNITEYNLVLRDQYRDWEIALGSFWNLPLLGPGTHVGGYTIGPGFYWILWVFRVMFAPWFENLPHAGGIGQAALQSVVDAVLFVAIWRRTGSIWMALATVTLVATSAFDLSFAATIWNPVVGSVLAKLAIALVLLEWPSRGTWHLVATMGVAWLAVHAYTGAVYVAVSVFLAIIAGPISRRAWREAGIAFGAAAGTVLALQIPYLWFQVSTHFRVAAMGAVTDGLAKIATGQATPEVAKSLDGLLRAFITLQVQPFSLSGVPVMLLAASMIVLVRFRRDPAVLAMTLAPMALAIAGYALFLAPLDVYYYMSLMTPMVLTIVLAIASGWSSRTSRIAGMVLCTAALLMVPARFQSSTAMNRMPQYGPLVKGSRLLAHRQMPLRGVRTTFELPPTGDPEVIYRFLGGQIDRSSRWLAVIASDGSVTYQDRAGA